MREQQDVRSHDRSAGVGMMCVCVSCGNSVVIFSLGVCPGSYHVPLDPVSCEAIKNKSCVV